MTQLENAQTYLEIETVIDLAVALSDCTQSSERCREIPCLLGQAFGIDDLTVAVVRQVQDEALPKLILFNCLLPAEPEGDARERVLEIYRQHKISGNIRAEGMGRTEILHSRHSSADANGGTSPNRKVVAFLKMIDRDHAVLIVIRRPLELLDFSMEVIESLRILTNELSKQFYCLIAWDRQCFILGKPFNQFTESEWLVLRGLTSEASEKQLAGMLQMRPHTLHSRIKSIYSKLDVQGRLPLIQKYNNAVSQMRIDIRRTPSRSSGM